MTLNYMHFHPSLFLARWIGWIFYLFQSLNRNEKSWINLMPIKSYNCRLSAVVQSDQIYLIFLVILYCILYTIEIWMIWMMHVTALSELGQVPVYKAVYIWSDISVHICMYCSTEHMHMYTLLYLQVFFCTP